MGGTQKDSKIEIKIGTNRFCILKGEFVYKFPIGRRGRKANEIEYTNYLSHQDIVARTEKFWWGLRQERLTDITIYPLGERDVREEHKFLLPYALHNRMQIGKSKTGNFKFFDFEDIKYYLNS